MSQGETITIAGAGLAGALLACHLARAGWRVDLHERRSDPRSGTLERGRSINLALSTRGLHALDAVGLKEEVLRQAIPMRGRMIHHADGSLVFQPYGTDAEQVLYSVSRSALNRLLVEAAAKYPSVRLLFGQRCVGADLDVGTLQFAGPEGEQTINAEVIVGADGVYSAVRAAMQRRERFDFSQAYLDHGYKELEIAPDQDGNPRLEKNALHIWPRGGFMMIALPNSDGSFTGTLFWPYEGANSFAALQTDADIQAFFQTHFPDALALLPDLTEQYRRNAVGPLVTVRCRPWHVGARAVLIGDAAHGVVPFLGQGMNAAFEDCLVLVESLRMHPTDRLRAFARYEQLRKPHLDTLAQLCLENFLEMRDRVGSRWFVLRKRLNLLIHRLLPQTYLPLYTMVEFTRIPYADAVRRARQQERVVAALCLALGLLILGVVLLLW